VHFQKVRNPANKNRNILADKRYVDSERKARLSEQGWQMDIKRKGSKDKLIADTQQRRNRRIAKASECIEHVFIGTPQMGGEASRSIATACATLHLNWKVVAYNLQRHFNLKEVRVEAF